MAPGGSIFIVYADLAESSEGEADCGMAMKYFQEKYLHKPFADNLRLIYQTRNQLLGTHGSVVKHLAQRYPNSKAQLTSVRKKSHFFGKSKEDIAVLAMATELCSSDS